MVHIDLTIVKPANGAVFVQPKAAASPVEFQGAASLSAELAGVPIYYRWYASLRRLAKDAHGEVSQFSINASALADATTRLSADLPMGSHVIAFAASDRSLESELTNARHGGVAGGVNTLGVGHVIHVLKANIVAPIMAGGDPVSVSSATRFQAEAPWPFEDDAYQIVNGLRFSWVFAAIAANPSTPGQVPLVFDESRMCCKKQTDTTPAVLELDPDTYKDLHGTYRVTLNVEAGLPKTIASDDIVVVFP